MRAVGPVLSALALAAGAGTAVPAVTLVSPDSPDGPAVAENLRGGLRAGLETLGAEQRARAGLLPGEVPEAAEGSVRTVEPDADVSVPDRADVRTVRVQVEDGLPVDDAAFAEHVFTTLNDDRGWGHDGSVGFAPAGDDDPVDLTVTLASPALVDELCDPLRTMGQFSCAMDGVAAINAQRWAAGAEPFLDGGGSLPAYRQYLLNHEVGHLLGHGHTPCPEPGEPAPVMLQQSMRLEGCAPNGWPADESA